jgi:hypothetical protein
VVQHYAQDEPTQPQLHARWQSTVLCSVTLLWRGPLKRHEATTGVAAVAVAARLVVSFRTFG